MTSAGGDAPYEFSMQNVNAPFTLLQSLSLSVQRTTRIKLLRYRPDRQPLYQFIIQSSMDGLTKIIPLSVPRGRYRRFSEFNWFVPVCAINQCFFVDNDENENGLWPIFIYLFIYLFIYYFLISVIMMKTMIRTNVVSDINQMVYRSQCKSLCMTYYFGLNQFSNYYDFSLTLTIVNYSERL